MAKKTTKFAGKEITGKETLDGVLFQDNTPETRGAPRRVFVSVVTLLYLPKPAEMITVAALQQHGIEYVPAEGFFHGEVEQLDLPENLRKVIAGLFVWPNYQVLSGVAKAARRRK